ncbi:MAG: N-6 DNA methylase [Syntrophobacteraceae bacterium]|nr:N-6 DNA methylase [Syntrophobacteraceae bacterium]
MSNPGNWLTDFSVGDSSALVDGLVPVQGYVKEGRPFEEVAIMEKAEHYRANAVFFEAPRDGKAPVAQAFIYRSDGPALDPEFAQLHQRLWSWGGVPLVYRVTSGLVQLFRCAHRPDFESGGKIVFKPFKKLKLASQIAADPWWDAERLRTGTLWDDPAVCKQLLSSKQAAQKTLINAIKELYQKLDNQDILPKVLLRRLLILSVLIAYLEKRGVFEDGFFARFLPGAGEFFQVLANGPALVDLLNHLEERFNGHVFIIGDEDCGRLRDSKELPHYARLVEGRQEPGGQLTLWQRYSFADLPVELISHIYQLFVKDMAAAVYTPHFVVRLLLGEVLSPERLDRLEKNDEIILDPACGSGIFLVEAYKRLVLHWRSRNNWKRPDQATLQRLLTTRLCGIDLEEGAVELAAFSLCLALCDALEPEAIRASVKLFPPLKEKTIHTGCFFEARELQTVQERVGVIVGNPPFASELETYGAQRAYERYQEEHGALPDKQVAYLFLHESMGMLAPGGVLCMLQQYNFLYNQRSLGFRRKFIELWDVREILDLISVRGLFQKGGADTKVVVIVAEAQSPPPKRQILHATFRRSGRASAEQGFDIDYYDMHWLPRDLVLENDGVWRCDLLGGGRVLGFVDRLRKFRTLGQFAVELGWDHGEGFIVGKSGKRPPASHLTGKPFLPSKAIMADGIDENAITEVKDDSFKTAYSPKRFSPPMLLIREHMDIECATWFSSYLTYKNKVVGINGAKPNDASLLTQIESWLKKERLPLRAYAAAVSVRLFTQKATTLSEVDILSLPFPESGSLSMAAHEQIIVADIVDYYRDLVRLGEDSKAMKEPGISALPAFNDVFTSRINAVYKKNKLHALDEHAWPGVICQPYIFGEGRVDWTGANELKGKLDVLLREKRGGGLNVTRIARLYDGACIYLLKPDRLRYWLRSIALRDADETLADLAEQGF